MAYIFNSYSSLITFRGNIIIVTEARISNGIAYIIMLLPYNVFATRNKSLFLYITRFNTLIQLGCPLYRYRSLIALSIALKYSSLFASRKARSSSYTSYNCLSTRDVRSSRIRLSSSYELREAYQRSRSTIGFRPLRLVIFFGAIVGFFIRI